ncbi:MAG: hypothetical protein ABFD08_17970 [Syntrophomonas sp.]
MIKEVIRKKLINMFSNITNVQRGLAVTWGRLITFLAGIKAGKTGSERLPWYCPLGSDRQAGRCPRYSGYK